MPRVEAVEPLLIDCAANETGHMAACLIYPDIEILIVHAPVAKGGGVVPAKRVEEGFADHANILLPADSRHIHLLVTQDACGAAFAQKNLQIAHPHDGIAFGQAHAHDVEQHLVLAQLVTCIHLALEGE